MSESKVRCERDRMMDRHTLPTKDLLAVLIIYRSNLNLNIYLIHQMFHAIIALVIFVVIKTIVAIIAIAVLGGRVAQRPR